MQSKNLLGSVSPSFPINRHEGAKGRGSTFKYWKDLVKLRRRRKKKKKQGRGASKPQLLYNPTSFFKYAYLEDKEKFPVIISASLAAEQEKLLLVLKKHKKAIGWT